MKGFVHLGIVVIVGLALLVTGATIYEQKYMQPEVSFGAPVSNIFNNILPSANQTYDIGSTTPAAEWKNIYTKNITISGTCTGCGSGSTFPFTPTDYGNSTSTTIGLLQGFLSNASSTITASTTISGVLTASGGIYGNLTGLASLATALNANGANCSAGSYPLGVDASGAVEDCTVAGASSTFPFTPTSYGNSTSSVIAFTVGLISQSSTTIPVLGSGLVGANNGLLYGFASSSLFGYTPLNPTRALTIAGTANQLTSSAGGQDLL